VRIALVGCTLQHTVAHCNTLQHTATIRQEKENFFYSFRRQNRSGRQHTAAHCSTLQHTATIRQEKEYFSCYFRRQNRSQKQRLVWMLRALVLLGLGTLPYSVVMYYIVHKCMCIILYTSVCLISYTSVCVLCVYHICANSGVARARFAGCRYALLL